jgi:hypothetical protein|tara:strand:+ start:567 stop:947 length:381 start_codon:yes stop_codon:yes gene_type:complete
MTNSDTTFGTHNKQSAIMSQNDGDHESFVKTVFANTDDAIDFFFTSDAQAVFNECCTLLQWALVDDNGKNSSLKYTMAFGTKGGDIAAADDWAEQWKSRMATLQDNSNWATANSDYTSTASGDHLF